MKTYKDLLPQYLAKQGENEQDIVYSSVDLDDEFSMHKYFEVYTSTNIYQLADSRSPVCMRATPRNPPVQIRATVRDQFLLVNQNGTSFTYCVFDSIEEAKGFAKVHNCIVEEYVPCQDQ